MIASWFVRSRARTRGIQARDQDHSIAERLQRFCDERKLKVRPFLKRTPVSWRRTMRMPYADKASHGTRACCSLPYWRLRGQHGFKKRQCYGHAATAKEGPSRNVFLDDKHLPGLHNVLVTKRHRNHNKDFAFVSLVPFCGYSSTHSLRFRPASSSSGMEDSSQYPTQWMRTGNYSCSHRARSSG